MRESQFIMGEKVKLEHMIDGTEKYERTMKLLSMGSSVSKVPNPQQLQNSQNTGPQSKMSSNRHKMLLS
jgi:hypothetical protein